MIQIKGLNKTYGRRRGDNRVLRDVTLTLPDTGFVCILGPSGCGKTSLLNAIGGLDKFDNGTIATESVSTNRYGKALFEAERNRNFGYIFQNYYLLPEHTVGYNVYLGLHSLKLSHNEKLDRVEEALRAVEMERYFHRNVGDLSGGQQQRVAIARALARKPRVIFADEPTGNLDEANTRNICALLRKISKTNLVVMVTHEQRIARFFADRIISLDNGVISGDEQDFRRGELTDTATLYTGDYKEVSMEAPGVRVRYYQQEDCPGVDVSILALKDRIVIKLSDGRTISCGQMKDQPVVVEGVRPEITLEELEQEHLDWQPGENVPCKAGRGIRFGDMFREARHINREKGLRSWGTRLFLLILTVLTALSMADFIALSKIDPEDFIDTHSQMLEIRLERGSGASSQQDLNILMYNTFKSYLQDCGQDYAFVPHIVGQSSVSGGVIKQMKDLSVTLTGYNYVPMDMLDESTLIMGRMPENGSEIVIDRWVLEAALERDGVAQNGVTGIDYFLDKSLKLEKKEMQPTIVGICDSGEPAVYMSKAAMVSLATGGVPVATISDLQKAYPGVFDDLELGLGECAVSPEQAGFMYENLLGGTYTVNAAMRLKIAALIEEEYGDFYPHLIVSDEQMDAMLEVVAIDRFYVFCEDKVAMADYISGIPEKMDDAVKVTIYDNYITTMRRYQEASQARVDARTIVTATVIVLCMVMLYLLRRAQVMDRIGMLSVYRLLGIPRRKAVSIFCLESLIGSLTVVLPVAVATWAVLLGLNSLPETQTEMLLPLQAALAVGGGIAVFYMLVTVLPLHRLLRMPPAQLAAKFDF